MKKSPTVPASLIISLAASLTAGGCGSSYTNQCQDASGRVLADSACRGSAMIGGAHWVRVRSGGFGGSGGGSYGG